MPNLAYGKAERAGTAPMHHYRTAAYFPKHAMAVLFRETDFTQNAFPAVIREGGTLYERGAVKKLEMAGADYVGQFDGAVRYRTVLSRASARLQYTCTCGFSYGGACEHVVALMRAINASETLQTGMVFDSLAPATRGEAQNVDTDEERDDVVEEPAAPLAIATRRSAPQGRLYLEESDGLLLIEPRFAYCDGLAEFKMSDPGREKLVSAADGTIVRIERARAREMVVISELESCGLRRYSSSAYTPQHDAQKWVTEQLPRLASAGFAVFGSERLSSCRVRRRAPSIQLSVSGAGSDFLGCRLDVRFDGIPAALCSLYEAAVAGNAYVKLSDGSSGELPAEWLERLRLLFSLSAEPPGGNELVLDRKYVQALDALDSIVDSSVWDTAASAARTRMNSFTGITPRTLPRSFTGSLRPYQQAGFEWLTFLREFNLGGCLADDMGLGKTVQTIAFLCAERERGARPRQTLLVAPTTLLGNWVRETHRFGPALIVAVYHGPGRKRYSPRALALADIVLTTYGTLLRDIETLSAIEFNCVILDEAQAIKTPSGAIAGCARRLRAHRRIALSGTPLENNLSELWSLMSFLNPGMLGTYSHFVKNIARPIERDRSGPAASLLRRIVHPCILRRTKSQVATDLPPRTETVIRVTMQGRQRTLYDMTAEAFRARFASLEDSGVEQSRMEILAALMRLRQICCHPLLLDQQFSGDSAKFTQLDAMLEEILAEDHKVLVFSTFVESLKIASAGLCARRVRHEMLTGQTVERQAMVDRFQSDPDIRVMLISLKAGGTGLNLTAADYVIHLDPWWNPAAEAQASDRAYRIGQRRPVFVYKLVCEDSIEERMLAMQSAKRELFDLVVRAEPSHDKRITVRDLASLFEPSQPVLHCGAGGADTASL